MHTRADLIRAAWDASAWQFPDGYTVEDFTRDAGGCDFWPIMRDGLLRGAVMIHGCEIHICVSSDVFKRWMTPSLYRRIRNLLRVHGRLTTRVHQDHEEGIRFVRRSGFRMIGNIGPVILFEMR